MKISNPTAWAIGTLTKRGWRIRRIVWGRLLAREERRRGEVIMRVRVAKLEAEKVEMGARE